MKTHIEVILKLFNSILTSSEVIPEWVIGLIITDIYLLARVFMDYDMGESKKIEVAHSNPIIKILLFMEVALI